MKEYFVQQRNAKLELWKLGLHNGRRGKTGTAHWIRDYMLAKCQFKCTKCNWGEINRHTNKVPLELEHIDGDYLNNKEENLTILCPNCHSLTPTYKGANKIKGRPRAKYYRGT